MPGGAGFPRDTLVTVHGLKPLRLDVVLFFAKHLARQNWQVDRVNYVKARAASPAAAQLQGVVAPDAVAPCRKPARRASRRWTLRIVTRCASS